MSLHESGRPKRKRAQISYAEDEDELDALCMVHGDVQVDRTESDNLNEVETVTFGNTALNRRPSKRVKLHMDLQQGKKRKHKQKHFPFMSLPAELRDNVYKMALTDPNGLILVAKTKNHKRTVGRGIGIVDTRSDDDDLFRWRRHRARKFTLLRYTKEYATTDRLVLALLVVSKQIHEEAADIMYGQNIILEDTLALNNFLATIGSNRKLLANMTLKGWGWSGVHKAMNFAAFTLMSECTKLKRFNIDCDLGCRRKPELLSRLIYREACYFLEAYGAAHGKKDAAIAILTLSEENYKPLSWMGRSTNMMDKDEYKKQAQEELRWLLTRAR